MSNVYVPKGKAREYSPRALNYFRGCDHGCRYCYVPGLMKSFNSSYVHDQVRCDLSKVRDGINRFGKSKERNEQVLLSFTGDPYCNFDNGHTRRVLFYLLEAGCHVALLTKNPVKALKDSDIMLKFPHFKIGTTLTCLDDEDSLFWEPGAPTGRQRIEALREFSKMGIKTWVSFEPVLFPEQTLQIIRKVADFVDHVKIGKLNNHPREKDIDWESFANESILLLRELGVDFYVKNDLARFVSIPMTKIERDMDYLNV